MEEREAMYRKILVPLDGSRLGERPLDYAVWLARKTEAELILMHVYRNRIPEQSHYLQRVAGLIERRSPEIENGRPPIRVRIESASGDAAFQILKYTDDNKVDLIIMSTHGHSGFRHWLLGSVADRVMRYSNRPVRMVNPAHNKVGYSAEYDRRVLVLLDGSELAEQILPYAAYHAGLSGGELVLLSVCEPAEVEVPITYHLIPQGYPPERPLVWEKYVKQETEKREKECRLYLEEQAGEHPEDKFRIWYEYRFGKADEEITRYLESNPVSLVAMTTRGRSGLSRWVFGSVAEKVLTVSKCPVLIMRPG